MCGMPSFKICMLAPEFLYVWGGVGSYITELVRHLPRDIEIHIVTPFREAIGKDKITLKHYRYSKYFSENVHIHFISRATDSFFYNAKFQVAVSRYVPKLIKKQKMDLIHSHTAHMPDILLQFSDIKIPIVTTIHTTIKGQREGTKRSGARFRELETSEKATIFLYPFLRLIEKIYFMKDRYYITASNWMKEQVLRLYPKLRGKIHVIHNAIDTEFWKRKRNYESKRDELGMENIILYVGRLLALKGIKDTINVMPRILKEERDTLFMFIGPGNKDIYKKMLNKMGVPKRNYAFLGYKSRDELLNYYSMATVFVLPSYSENMPMTLLEAMSCSLPVVATKVGGIPEVVDHNVNGILINPGNIDELTHSLIYLLQDKSLRTRLGFYARKKIEEKFSWKKIVPKVIEVYERAIMSNR